MVLVPVSISINQQNTQSAMVDTTWKWANLVALIQNQFRVQPEVVGHEAVSMNAHSQGTLVEELAIYDNCTLIVSVKAQDGLSNAD
jgi:hypothetical protein